MKPKVDRKRIELIDDKLKDIQGRCHELRVLMDILKHKEKEYKEELLLLHDDRDEQLKGVIKHDWCKDPECDCHKRNKE